MARGRDPISDDSARAQRRVEFETLYESYSRELWALVYARRLNADAAMDAVQEAFLRLWREWETGTVILNTRGWLLKVARNLAEDQARSAFQRNGTQPTELLESLQSGQETPIDRMQRDEEFAKLRVILAELSKPDREILSLRYTLDYDSEAIAKCLGVNVSAVHMRLSRARQRLAERLAQNKDSRGGNILESDKFS